MSQMVSLARLEKVQPPSVRQEWARQFYQALDDLHVEPGDDFIVLHPDALSGRIVRGTGECTYCGSYVDTSTGYRRIRGWERKAVVRPSGARGGSDIFCREQMAEWACDSCVGKLRRGVSPNQAQIA